MKTIREKIESILMESPFLEGFDSEVVDQIEKLISEEREKIKKDFKKIIKEAKENNSYEDYTDDAYYAIKDIENDFLNKLNNEKDSI